MTDAQAAVRCRGLVKSYGEGAARAQALRGVDLDVRRGELFMLVGPSGCGKTTLISVMAGILNQDEGACQLLGQDLAALSPRERTAFRGRNIGFVFQAFNLLPALSVAENVGLPLLIAGVPRVRALQEACRMLESVGLAGLDARSPRDLSGGQQQRVAIARALVHSPGLVVCDEPTSALDHAAGQSVMELLKNLATGGGCSLVIVTHDPRVFGYADRMAHMDDGRILRVEVPASAQGVTP
ncbi:putative ABC transporter ATP-binding protein YknY [Fundidesulfovibrio magnetotacticus]|uniref:Putative ABC transporter ATP-binding protein YknY n=2 Tax=Fundidesulfovibrio magnetotacticus TaxID=2730080 RepID=A0A6V8LVV0_9BACT|nr:putative ABC transporter ATP-binding protein YknY [Fundidesulfovibrio magnetotacticus]